jgi:hypothetical protein
MRNTNTDLFVVSGGMTSTDVGCGQKLKKLSVTVTGEWILTAWGRISSEYILAGFKNSCLANALDGTGDNFLWQDAEDKTIL